MNNNDQTPRPALDATGVTAWLQQLAPLHRVAAADAARDEALGLVGEFAEIRRQALAEAHAQGEDVELSSSAIREAIRPDRQLLQSALEVLTRDGVSAAKTGQLAAGLKPRAPLEAIARRVLMGLSHLAAGAVLTSEEHELVTTAGRRARQCLPHE